RLFRMVVEPIGKVRCPCRHVRPSRHTRRVESFDLTRDQEGPLWTLMIIEGFDTEAIARGKKSLCAAVPDKQREHAKETVQALLTPPCISSEHNLRISVAAELIVAQLRAEFEIVIDLSVEDDPRGAVTACHGLMAC